MRCEIYRYYVTSLRALSGFGHSWAVRVSELFLWGDVLLKGGVDASKH